MGGSRFSEKDMRQHKNLEHIPIQLNRDLLGRGVMSGGRVDFLRA
jgi:hypothetical protein